MQCIYLEKNFERTGDRRNRVSNFPRRIRVGNWDREEEKEMMKVACRTLAGGWELIEEFRFIVGEEAHLEGANAR